MKFEGIDVEVKNRAVKYPRIEFGRQKLMLIIPSKIDPRDVLDRNKRSILKKYEKLQEQIRASRKMIMLKRTDEDFEKIIDRYVEKFRKKLGIEIKDIKMRKMRRRWGSCRSNGIVTLNRRLQVLPEYLIAYVIFHELAHRLIKGHNKRFKLLISKEFPCFREYDRTLNLYGIRLLSPR